MVLMVLEILNNSGNIVTVDNEKLYNTDLLWDKTEVTYFTEH